MVKLLAREGFDLVAYFDYLHDMGDPVGAAAHVRQSLKPDGSWMIVEPIGAALGAQAGEAKLREVITGRWLPKC